MFYKFLNTETWDRFPARTGWDNRPRMYRKLASCLSSAANLKPASKAPCNYSIKASCALWAWRKLHSCAALIDGYIKTSSTINIHLSQGAKSACWVRNKHIIELSSRTSNNITILLLSGTEWFGMGRLAQAPFLAAPIDSSVASVATVAEW